MIVFILPTLYLLAALFFYLRSTGKTEADEDMMELLEIYREDEWRYYNGYFAQCSFIVGIVLLILTFIISKMIELPVYLQIIILVLQVIPYIFIALRSKEALEKYRNSSD